MSECAHTSECQPIGEATLSVVIIAKNEERFISRCIESILAQRAHKVHEIIVVDNGSTDRTVDVARAHGVQIVSSDSGYIGELRNIGASAASGNIIGYIDADCTAGPDWAFAALSRLEDPAIDAVAGHLSIPDSANWVQRMWALPIKPLDRTFKGVVGASLFITKTAFDTVGGFRSDLNTGEDTDIAERLSSRGFSITREIRCNVVHWGYPSSLLGIIDRQAWQVYGQYSPRKLFSPTIQLGLWFMVLLVASILLVIFQQFAVSGFCLLAALLPPTIFTIKKVGESRVRPGFVGLVQVFTISVAYLLGRAIGAFCGLLGLRYKRAYK